MTAITYQEPPFTITVNELPWQRAGLQQTATGYGSKLTTSYMLSVPDSKRVYRVYAICYSNAASFYILRNGTRVFLRDWELEEARDRATVISR